MLDTTNPIPLSSLNFCSLASSSSAPHISPRHDWTYQDTDNQLTRKSGTEKKLYTAFYLTSMRKNSLGYKKADFSTFFIFQIDWTIVKMTAPPAPFRAVEQVAPDPPSSKPLRTGSSVKIVVPGGTRYPEGVIKEFLYGTRDEEFKRMDKLNADLELQRLDTKKEETNFRRE